MRNTCLFVIDEASGVMDPIYETIEGALTTKDAKLLLCGNPTQNIGTFKRAFHEDRDLYYTIKVNCMDTDRVASAYCQRLIRQYGMDSDVVRVRVLGEFPKSEPDGLIPLELVEAAMMRDLDIDYNSMLHVGADIARFGDDETIFVLELLGKHWDYFTIQSKIQLPQQVNCVEYYKEFYERLSQAICDHSY